MRVRDRDRANAAELSDLLDGRVIDDGYAIPQKVALRRANQQRALADGERRVRPDADQAEVVADLVLVLFAKFIKGGPSLARPSDVLSLVLADWAVLGWVRGGRELDSTGGADVAERPVDIKLSAPETTSRRVCTRVLYRAKPA
jgi:hypothetical protein